MAESNGEFPTVIGPDAVFKGELTFEKGVRLLGQFEGQIDSKGSLVIAEGAKLAGDVKAGSVKVDGVVNGNLETSGKIQLSATARLEGDLKSARLEVSDGATFQGRVVVGPQNGKAPAPAASSSPSTSANQASGQSADRKNQQPVAAGKR